MGIASNIAGRCHVSDSEFKVIRTVYYAIGIAARRNPRLRSVRKVLYHEAIMAHRANRKLYRAVMLRG